MKKSLKETIDTYNKAALNYQNKFMNMTTYDDTYDKFCDLIPKKNPDILEIACGPGNITKYILNKRPDFNLLGIDLAPKMIELAKQNNPKADFKVMDCKNIQAIDKNFDAIMCGFCMPYLSKEEVENLIFDSSKILNQSGIFYISTMEDDYKKSGYETTSFGGDNRVYIYYYQYSYLLKTLTDAGFKVLKTYRKDYEEIDGTITTDLIIIAQKVN